MSSLTIDACIRALDFMPGCDWPLWLQILPAWVLYACVWTFRARRRKARR